MSGFVALFNRSGADVRDERFQAMLDAIDHRGPDGSGTWRDNGIALGHQQLRSTPQARYDDQPTRHADIVVTGDIRIDNRDKLLDTLPISDPPEVIPDSRIVAGAYREWGVECVSHLVGSFAFVVWDNSESRLFLARDRFGVKPLYYHLDEDVFAAASEKKALLTLPSVPGAVDDVKIGDFLLAMYEDQRRTFFESVQRLPPAHAMTVGADQRDTRRYWDLDPSRTVTLESDTAYECRFRELFEQAVGSRLRSDPGGRVGTTLSGGMDSSSIAVVARDLLSADTPLATFSNVYDEAPSSDEREFIEPVTRREGIEPNYVFPESTGVVVDEPVWRTHLDQPPHNTMHFAVWERTKRAADAGMTAVLDGALGDSATGYGLGLFSELFRAGRWRHLYAELDAMADVVDASVRHLFVRHVLSAFVPDRVTQLRRRLRGDPAPLNAENPTLDPRFVERADLRARHRENRLQNTLFAPRARTLQHRSLLTGRNTTNFEVLDLIHAAFGVEPRYPFTDVRLVEFSLAIPPTQQFAEGYTRSIIRRALADLLPEEVQWRPWKTPVNEAFWNALGREERLNGVDDIDGPLAEYLDPDALKAARDRFEADPTSADARALWRALSVSIWLDEYHPSAPDG